jgi:hypothetical protein
MAAPDKILELVETFERNIDSQVGSAVRTVV